MPVTLEGKWEQLPKGTYEIRDPFDGGIDPFCPGLPHWGILEQNYRGDVHNQQVFCPYPYTVDEQTGSAYYEHNGWAFPESWLHPVGEEVPEEELDTEHNYYDIP